MHLYLLYSYSGSDLILGQVTIRVQIDGNRCRINVQHFQNVSLSVDGTKGYNMLRIIPLISSLEHYLYEHFFTCFASCQAKNGCNADLSGTPNRGVEGSKCLSYLSFGEQMSQKGPF